MLDRFLNHGEAPNPGRAPQARRVTRSARLWVADAKRSPIPLPEGIVYLSLPGSGVGGDVPPGAFVAGYNDQCGGVLSLQFVDARRPAHYYEPECTLAVGHDGPHVAHIGDRAPVAAWTDQEPSNAR